MVRVGWQSRRGARSADPPCENLRKDEPLERIQGRKWNEKYHDLAGPFATDSLARVIEGSFVRAGTRSLRDLQSRVRSSTRVFAVEDVIF